MLKNGYVLKGGAADKWCRLWNVSGMTLWPFILVLSTRWSERLVRHEMIHIRQQREMLVVPFYIWYVLEWLIRLPFYGSNAYYNISFEREAYSHDDLEYSDYLERRKPYSWFKYLWLSSIDY